MAFRFKAQEPARDGVVRIVSEEVADTVEQLGRHSAKQRDHAIHEARKSLKKVRGLLKLIRPEIGSGVYGKENRVLRDTGRVLSELRDANAIIQTFDDLAAKYNQESATGLAIIRKALLEAKRQKEQSVDVADTMSGSARQLKSLVRRAGQWPVPDEDFAALAPGLKACYRAGRRAMKRALRTERPGDYHEWRKRAKDHWYHVRLLENAWTAAMETRENRIHEIERSLGEDHNLFILCEQINTNPDFYGGAEIADIFIALAKKEQNHLRQNAKSLGLRVYGERSRAFVDSMEKLWHTWKSKPTPRDIEAKAPIKPAAKKTLRKRVA